MLPTAGVNSLLGRVLFGTPLLCAEDPGDGVLICTAVQPNLVLRNTHRVGTDRHRRAEFPSRG